MIECTQSQSDPVAWCALLLLFFATVFIQGCSTSGRVSIILDTSSSMAIAESTGVPFSEVKNITISALELIPKSNQIGMRVFSGSGSRLVAPYSHDLSRLQRELAAIEPSGGTYIGASLLDSARDLAQFTAGPIRLFLFTDGAGSESDIKDALRVRSEILANRSDFDCTFVVFNSQPIQVSDSIIGRAAGAMGCAIDAPGSLSRSSLHTALMRVFGHSFFLVWLLISAFLFIVLVFLTASLVFASSIASGASPRRARMLAGIYLISMTFIVIAIHSLVFDALGSSAIAFLAALALLATLGSVFLGAGKKKVDTHDLF